MISSLPPVTRILVPTNLTPAARAAYAHAARLALALGARVTMLHVDELAAPDLRSAGGLEAYLESASEKRRQAFAEAQADFERWGVEMDLHVLKGSPKKALPEYVAGGGEDTLVVMAKSNRSGLEELLLGSVTQRVMRMSPVPVLVVNVPDALESAPTLPEYAHIVTGTDLSEASRRGAAATLSLATRLGARVTLVHVVRLPRLLPVPTLPKSGLDELQASWEGELAKQVEEIDDDRLDALLVLGGNPGDSLVDTARNEGADMLTIPSSGVGALERFFVGSTAERVARRSTLPVLLMPASYLERFRS